MPAMSGAAGFESSKRLETRSQGAKDRKAQAMKRYGGQTAKAVNTVGLAIGQTRVAFSGTPVDNKGADFQTLPEHSHGILPGFAYKRAGSRRGWTKSEGAPSERVWTALGRQREQTMLNA